MRWSITVLWLVFSFFFGCKDEAFRLVGQSSKNDNIVRCGADGVWDFGNMRCEGPVCEDPGRPPDGIQVQFFLLLLASLQLAN